MMQTILYKSDVGPDGVRNNLAPSGVGVVPGGPYQPVIPQQHMIPPQYSGMMPPFVSIAFIKSIY